MSLEKKTVRPNHRPRKEIDYKTLEKLALMQCTQLEICAFFEMCEDTLNLRVKEEYGKTFSEYIKEKGEKGKISLRRNLMNLSEHNASAAIFLSKNILGYTDKVEQDIKGDLVIKVVKYDESEDE